MSTEWTAESRLAHALAHCREDVFSAAVREERERRAREAQIANIPPAARKQRRLRLEFTGGIEWTPERNWLEVESSRGQWL